LYSNSCTDRRNAQAQRHTSARRCLREGEDKDMSLEWPTDRIDYVPIHQRPLLPLPGGAKVVVWPCVNVENWVIDQPMPRTVVNPPGGVDKNVPDIPNWAWHEYGQRVG
jgi:hypothetical protein